MKTLNELKRECANKVHKTYEIKFDHVPPIVDIVIDHLHNKGLLAASPPPPVNEGGE